MKKRLLSLLLSLAMIITTIAMLPLTGYAADAITIEAESALNGQKSDTDTAFNYTNRAKSASDTSKSGGAYLDYTQSGDTLYYGSISMDDLKSVSMYYAPYGTSITIKIYAASSTYNTETVNNKERYAVQDSDCIATFSGLTQTETFATYTQYFSQDYTGTKYIYVKTEDSDSGNTGNFDYFLFGTESESDYEATLTYTSSDTSETQNGTLADMLAAVPSGAENAVITINKDATIADSTSQITLNASVKITSNTSVTVTQGECICIPGSMTLTLDGNVTWKGTSTATSGYDRRHMFAIKGGNGQFVANSGVTLDYTKGETATEFSIVRTDWNGSGQQITINGATVNGGKAALNYTNSNNEDTVKITGAATVNAAVQVGYVNSENSHTVLDLDGYTGTTAIPVKLYTTTKNVEELVVGKNISDISNISFTDSTNSWMVELSGTNLILKASEPLITVYQDATIKTTKQGGYITASPSTASEGETVTLTTRTYYGFEDAAPIVTATTADGEVNVEVTGSNNSYSFTGISGATAYTVKPGFTLADNKKVLYIADSTVSGNCRNQVDGDISVMNYTKNDAMATWTSQDMLLNGTQPTSAKVIVKKENDDNPYVTLTVGDNSAKKAISFDDTTKFTGASNSYYVCDIDLTSLTFGSQDTVKMVINSSDGTSNNFLGHYWYIVFDYTQVFGEQTTDSGYYYDTDGTMLGVIRFLQGFYDDFDATSVTAYGFYIMKGTDGSFVYDETHQVAGGDAGNFTDGFYADLINIANTETDTTFSAKAYVTTADGIYWADSQSSSVNWTTQVTYPDSSN